jgi:hypothetical protein
MKIDTRIVAALLMVLIYLSTGKLCQAQQGEGRPPRMSADQIVSSMKKSLDLTDEQVKQILPVIKEEMSKREELMGQGGGPGDFESMKSDMEKIDKETETELAKYLTEEQIAKWKKQQSERKSRMGRGPGGGMGGGPPGM